MTSLPQVARAMQVVLTEKADEFALKTKFVRRQSKMTGSKFVATTVLGWLADPDASLEDLAQTAASLGVTITPQGIDERFNEYAAQLLQITLEEVTKQVISTEPVAIPLLQRFASVHLADSTTIALPDSLATCWPGCGGTNGPTGALKLHVRLNLSEGTLEGPFLAPGREHDRSGPPQKAPLPAGALRLADLGYFDIAVLDDYTVHGVYFLTRILAHSVVYDVSGRKWHLEDFVSCQRADSMDQEILLGQGHGLKVRLLAQRVPPEVSEQRRRRLKDIARKKCQPTSKRQLALADWNILVTNVPAEKLTLAEALVLMRVRWQIELLFKLWKNEGRVDESRSEKSWRILCEVYAKLLAMVIQHWILLTCAWMYPDRSLTKAAATVRRHVWQTIYTLYSHEALTATLETIQRCLSVGCRINKRKAHPSTYQLLMNFT
jgi:hypothetical protein